jgi:hypothetical protein
MLSVSSDQQGAKRDADAPTNVALPMSRMDGANAFACRTPKVFL